MIGKSTIAMASILALSGTFTFAQEAPVSEISAEELIEALKPPKKLRLRGITPVLREEDMPRVDLTVEFQFGSAELTESAVELLASLGEALKSDQLLSYRFKISGHTDAVGNEEYNQRLSMSRAESVRYFLVENFGIDENRLTAEGYGESRLLFADSPDDPKNRRVEIMTMAE